MRLSWRTYQLWNADGSDSTGGIVVGRGGKVEDVGKVASDRFPGCFLQDQEIAGLDEDPFPWVAECAIQINGDGNLAAAGGPSDDGQCAGIGIPDTGLDQQTIEVVSTEGTVDERPADLGDRFQNVQIVVTW